MGDTRGVGTLSGPRVAGRLTPDLILRSPQFMNCIHQYELDLRGSRISMIENLGATENQFDAIDLTDNAIVRLEGFPKLPRLKQLYVNNNKVNRIARNLEQMIPNLESLILTNNRLAHLPDLDPLRSLPKLKYLSLIDNPVTKQPGYRHYVIARCLRLKVLDFCKVKQAERENASSVHGSVPVQAATFDPDEQLAHAKRMRGEEPVSIRKGPTADEATAIRAAIANASTLEEVRRLEHALASGQTHTNAMDEG